MAGIKNKYKVSLIQVVDNCGILEESNLQSVFTYATSSKQAINNARFRLSRSYATDDYDNFSDCLIYYRYAAKQVI